MAALLERLGYVQVRVRGSHAQYALDTDHGRHVVTVPMHRIVAKGTLADILKKVSLWTATPVEELVQRL
ncbi:MAG: type II toxin-antitoxin system HicA family toxin [Armatimonadetes bacterium]|nr:type II toxin-antitoxin system HicA family toxin [Armatimonadota bacterium]